MKEKYKALTIAGSDASGAAGMAADLKTFEEFGVYGMVTLTVIVTMNPKNWSHEIHPVDLDLIKAQLATNAGAIHPDAMKTGMLGSAALVELVADSIERYNLKNIVIDPVMVCKGIDDIMVPEAAEATKKLLVKHADVITPNTVEAAYLAGMDKLNSLDDIKEAATRIHEAGAKNVVIKSGSRIPGETMIDVLYDGKTFHISEKPKHKNIYNSGAGCSFSAAITANLAKGLSVEQSVANAKEFIHAAIADSFKLNEFHGALAPWSHRS